MLPLERLKWKRWTLPNVGGHGMPRECIHVGWVELACWLWNTIQQYQPLRTWCHSVGYTHDACTWVHMVWKSQVAYRCVKPMPNSALNGQNTVSSHNGAACPALLMTPTNVNLKDRSQTQNFKTPFHKVQKQARQIHVVDVWGMITLRGGSEVWERMGNGFQGTNAVLSFGLGVAYKRNFFFSFLSLWH